VAIKKPWFQGTIDESVYRTFMKEAKLWYGLTRKGVKGIVKVFSYGVKPHPWIAMEYIDGGSLARKVGKLSLKEASRIVIQILETMNTVNRLSGSIHRDIKPGNILLTRDGKPRIADWGLGKHLMEGTHTFGFKGTPYYSAPEQFDSKKFGNISWKSDLYQIGVMYYELLTGKKPFPDDSLNELMYHIINTMPDPPSTVNPSVPAALDKIVLRAMAKRQERRYEFIEMAKEIKKVIE